MMAKDSLGNEYHRAMSGPAPTLPPQVTAQLLADVDVIARRMARRIATELSLPEEFRRVGYLRSIVIACRDALRTLVRLLHDGRGLRTADLQRLGSMGAQQAEMGVPLEVLLAAYRLAARVVWQEVLGEAAGVEALPPATVIAVTGQVLEYLDEISGAVGAAYLETRERLMRQRDRERDRVLQRLLAGDVGPDLRRLAAASDLALQGPYRVVACAIQGGDEERALESTWRNRGALLVAVEPGRWIALLPADADAGAWRTSLEAALTPNGGGAARVVCGVGPVAARLEEVADATRRAREALHFGQLLLPEKLVHDDAAMGVYAMLAADRDRLQRFVERTLGPLAGPHASRYHDLLVTLEALLNCRSLAEASAQLGLHRHTVVYRTQRLHDLGIDIDAPEQRHQLWLALQARRLLADDE